MNKSNHIIIGILFWVILFFVFFRQIQFDPPISVAFLFLIFGTVLILSTINFTILVTKLYVEIRYLKVRKKAPYIAYIVFSLFNSLFIVLCSVTIFMLFLLY